MSESIRLDRVLDFLVFTNAAVTISACDNSQIRHAFSVVEVLPGEFEAEPLGSPVLQSVLNGFQSGELKASVGYKGCSLNFVAKLLSVKTSEETGKIVFRFSRPEKGALVNQRKDPRFKIEGKSINLATELVVRSSAGERKVVPAVLHDISHEAVGLFLSRDEGLVLPGDSIDALLISVDGSRALESSGLVIRTDMSRKTEVFKSSYYAVVRFSHAQADSLLTLSQELNRRRLDRVIFNEDGGAFVCAKYPLSPGLEVMGSLIDINTSGLRFKFKNVSFPIVPGMIFNQMAIQLPLKARLEASFKVTFAQNRYIDGHAEQIVGGQFIGMAVDLVKAVTQLSQSQLHSHLVDATRADHEELWQFFFESGFIYKEKRKQLQAYAQSVMTTYERLLSQENRLLKKIVFKESDGIKGHVSALRFFDNSWIIQHLNATQTDGPSAAKMVLKGITDFFYDAKANQLTSTGYVLCFYRPDNMYPSIIFGGAKEFVNNPSICTTQDLRFCVRAGDETVVPSLDDGTVREATRDDLHRLEHILIEQGYSDLIRIEGLHVEGVLDQSVSSEFKKLGLYRYRKVFIAEDHSTGGFGFAICNFASPGLNLSELTNSVRFFYKVRNHASNQGIADRLGGRLVAEFANTEMADPIVLLEDGQIVPRGFEEKKTYRYWSFNAKHVDQFRKALEYIQSNFKEYLRDFQKQKVSNGS